MRFSLFSSKKKEKSPGKDTGKGAEKPENRVVTYTKGGARGVRKVYSEKEDRTPGDRRIGVDWRYLGRSLTQFGVVLVSLAAVFYFGYQLVRVLMPGITVSDVVTISETYRCSGSAYLFCDSVPVKAKSAGFADYQIADGQISEGTTVTLREVKIGDAVLKNVDASVVNSQRAPLLLGQSAMERFGAITIDNQNNKLIIKH